MKNHSLTNQEIKSELDKVIRFERKVAHRLLVLLRVAESQKTYLEDGYPSLYEWLVKHFGYSESAAYRRICAARAMQSLPDAEEKILSGKVNLTTLSQAQSTFQKEERLFGTRITPDAKTDLLMQLEGKTSQETQKILVQAFPATANREESLRWINSREAKLTVIVGKETRAHLIEAKDRLSHTAPNASYGEVITIIAENFVNTEKPNRKNRIPAFSSELRKNIFARAGFRCEFVNRDTGKRCDSTYQLELDHIRPKALGGTDDPDNLRCLCKQHNLFMAEKNLGLSQLKFRKEQTSHTEHLNS